MRLLQSEGHVKADCWKLKWKENISPNIPTSNTVAATKKTAKTENTSAKDNTTEIPTDVACVRDNKTSQIQTDKSIVKVNYVEGNKCNLLALIDTGSSVSFIQRSVCKFFFDQNFFCNVTIVQHLRALNDSQIKVIGQKEISIRSVLPEMSTRVTFQIIDNDNWSEHI